MRRVHSIPGGIHPPENKSQSLGQDIQALPLPAKLVLPLSQHIGAPAAPLVAIGDRVLKGQTIAAAKGFVSAPVHAPSSGTITAIGPHPVPHPSGMNAPCITIETDGRDEWQPHQGVADYSGLDKAQLLDLIRSAGIVGMGGAGFPSAVKLASEKAIDTLIINGTECEPYITADDSLMQQRAEQIIAGTEILRHLVSPGETLIGIEDNKPRAIEMMQRAAAGSGIEIVSFDTKYPSGGEKQLIQIVTGKEVPSGGLPADIGVIMQNVASAAAVYRAVVHGEPLISRVTTVTGEAFGNLGNYDVLLGTPIQHLLDHCHLDVAAAGRLIMGGPMMGFALETSAIPIVKTSNCILGPSQQELPADSPAQACIRCGMCAQVCPASLLPQQLYWFARGKEFEKLEAHNLFDCIECGCCSYVCPSNIPLVQYYRASKAQISKQKQDNHRSEIAKSRFEARQQRLEHEQAEKEARRKARSAKAKQAKAAGSDHSSAVIQAAIERSSAKKAAQDPAQAAIARAKAARSGGAQAPSPADKVAKLEQRLAKALEKREQAREQGSDNLDAFEASVTTLQQKLDTAKADLATAPTAAVDPAQAAIERAKATRSGSTAATSASDKVAKLEQRLAKALEKREQAREQGSDTLDAFEASVTTLQQKLDTAKAELATAPTAAVDPAQAAIERAKATRAGGAAAPGPADKVAKLEQRLAKAAAKRDQAQDQGSDTLDAFEAAVTSLQQKLDSAKAELPPTSTIAAVEPAQDDAAAEAIARAIARRAAQGPPDTAEQKLAKLEARLATAREKLALAEAENSEHIDAFRQSVSKMEQKLEQAQQLAD